MLKRRSDAIYLTEMGAFIARRIIQLQEEFARKNAANSNQQVTTDTDDQPEYAALRKQAERLILQLAKGGYRAEAIAILEKQGAKKLGEVADEHLADVIAQAEKALEG